MLKTTRTLLKFTSVRSLSTTSYIPPNLAGVAKSTKPDTTENVEAGSNNVQDLVYLYKQLPKGPATKHETGSGLINWYRAKYFEGENASGAPIFHLIFGLFTIGYTLDYVNHLSHHKNVKYH